MATHPFAGEECAHAFPATAVPHASSLGVRPSQWFCLAQLMRTAHCIPSILSILCILCILCIALVATCLHHLDLGTLKCRSTAQVQDVLWCTRGQDDAAIARSHGNCLMNRISLDTRCLYVSFNDSLIILYHILLYIYMYVYMCVCVFIYIIYMDMALWHMVFRSHDSKPMRLNSACPLSHPKRP